MVCSLLSQAHFVGKVLIEGTRFVAAGGRARDGSKLPLPGWDGWGFGDLEVLEHVLSSLLLFISEGVQRCEGTVLYLWRGVLDRCSGRGTWGTLHSRESPGLEGIGGGGLTPAWRGNIWWKDMWWGQWWGTVLRKHLRAPCGGWHGRTTKGRRLLEAEAGNWSGYAGHGEHGGCSSGGAPHTCSRDTCGGCRTQLEITWM